MNKTTTFLVISLSLFTGSAALASDIYKYTDQDGNVHYVDRPTNAASGERVKLALSSARKPATSQAEANTPDWRERRAARKEEQESAAQAKSQTRERQRLCQQQRDRLEEYKVASRLYRMDEQGERVYLDEEQIEEARQQVRSQIQEHCSS